MSRTRNAFSAVKTEGGLLPQDLLARIQAGDPKLEGTKGETYHLGPHERIGEAANRSWSRLVATWNAFHDALDKEPESSLATGLTRDRWLLPLFQELGYGRLPRGRAITVDGKSFAVSHTWHRSPIHLLGCKVDLDRRQKGVAGAARSSPHGLVQDFLNRSDDHLWGFVSNGYRLRVLRDHHSLTRQAYVEFDLQAIMDGEQYSEFLLLWLVCHQSRVEAEKPEECWLETWVNTSREEGVRALDKLRDGVEAAIEALGTGFLKHKDNGALREALEKGGQERGGLDKQEFYRQILRLVYRLIFIFVAEEREALLDPSDADEVVAARARYQRFYSSRRIRDLSEKRRGGPHSDLWRGLALVMSKLDNGEPALALPALGSLLWGPSACPWLMDAECSNEHVLDAFRQLSHIQEGKTRYPVNWRNVGADELGSIYEGLLELHPRLNKEAGTFELDTAAGHERKTTGSYYTPTSLVDCLLDSALDPVLDEAAKKGEDAIMALKVCDPACGSGHFLVAAARRIAKRLASVRSGDDEPSPRDVQRALRDVVGRCVYGVDVNPMAVELCKVSLWMEAIEPGRPLSFLDSHIQCGNALLGTTPALMARGIPDDAFKPIEGDDKEVAKRLRERNRQERKTRQEQLQFTRPEDKQVFDEFIECDLGPHFDLASVRAQETCWVNLSRSRAFRDAKFLADAWCAAFLWPKQPGEVESAAVTQDMWRRLQRDVTASPRTTRKTVRDLAEEYQLFHWHLAFPAVFGDPLREFEETDTTGWRGGFDAVLGNPPWEALKVSETEWFAEVAPEVSAAETPELRSAAIARVLAEDEGIRRRWLGERRRVKGSRTFMKQAGLFPLCSGGHTNTYAVFSELSVALISSIGLLGLVVPTGIVSDSTTAPFAEYLLTEDALAALFDFVNSEGLFPAVKRHQRFSVLVVRGARFQPRPATSYAFFLTNPAQLRSPNSSFKMSPAEVWGVNPNTRTFPNFPSRKAAEFTLSIYRSNEILVPKREGVVGGSWQVAISRMFNMTDDDQLLLTESSLRAMGAVRVGNTFVRRSDGAAWLPLIDPKMVTQYNHRAASVSFSGHNFRKISKHASTATQLKDPAFLCTPVYWVDENEIDARIPEWDSGWLLVFKKVSGQTCTNLSSFVVVPKSATSASFPGVFTPLGARATACVLAFANSLVVEFVLRLKLQGLHLHYYLLEQLPVPPRERLLTPYPWTGAATAEDWIARRVLELTFTSWDMQPFARDLGWPAGPFRFLPDRRHRLACELDAAVFFLYGSTVDDVNFVMDSLPKIERRDVRRFGDFRTKRLVVAAFTRMVASAEGGEPYEPLTDPPPADPSIVHPAATPPSWADDDG